MVLFIWPYRVWPSDHWSSASSRQLDRWRWVLFTLIILVQCWATVCDARPTLYHYWTILAFQPVLKTENNSAIIHSIKIFAYINKYVHLYACMTKNMQNLKEFKFFIICDNVSFAGRCGPEKNCTGAEQMRVYLVQGECGYNLCGVGWVRIQNINSCAGSVNCGGPWGGYGHD